MGKLLALLSLLVLIGCGGDAGRAAAEAARRDAEAARNMPPHPDSLAGQIARPWRHVSGPVSEQKFKQDQEKCKVIAHQAPVAPAGTPEIKFLAVFISCLKAEGYEPEPR
jgi:hypothetical protein